MDLSEFLAKKTDTIIANWVEAVRQDKKIESANDLSRKAIENHISHVVLALATVLSEYQTNEIQPIIDASLHHGSLRAEQGFTAAEIAREYRILRQVIFSILEPQLLQLSGAEVMRIVGLINIVLDEAIGRCFQSYTEQRLAELNQLQNQLIIHNQELNRLLRANQENLSHLAHELKTPLTSIIGYSDLFLRSQRQKTEVKDNVNNLEHIERVLRNGRKLLHLINDTLELSRYEAGQMKLHPASINLHKLINDVCEMLEPLARHKNLQIQVDCDRAPNEVVTDSLRLQQIVTNLVSNAIRYTETGSIKITCQMWENDKWAIAITDTGIGIHKEDQTQIFESYFRVPMSNNSYLPESTGLGLAIASRLVKLLQGEIKLDSEVGVGSTFTVILPLEVKS
ncbi:HAMP domain-containing histidine kinase [Scytonema hofmannii FACHB-248]|uniref:histidine kinase n=1 Tax=Scytonema hofmannii FACHB-248 TaxID=1842502 RepID=A0ABR8GSE6_9CYAN|nr:MULTISPECIES: HAMP domain-containing sensor histidine kinase [Nostocales]MBD2606356.1 HAMP domain-containing histidine kinase [Scytonema hofmannii FACHB-248]